MIPGAGGQPSKSDTIKDGLTQTIAFSESMQAEGWGSFDPSSDLTRAKHGMVWLYRLSSPVVPANGRNPDAVQPSNLINGQKLNPPNGFETARPSSGHAGLVNVAMLGGSVSTMTEQIDYYVYQALMTPHTRASDAPYFNYLLKQDDYD
jgi:hypothetical protein